ncbi:MAG: amidohydrolase family protein [Propionibacteriales bacterium]|nr:amidohydrolase family protein [Propionibacteriales bacterium]
MTSSNPVGRRTLLVGGSVYAASDPHATAIALDGTQVVWVGDDDGAERYRGEADEVVELDGRLVAPAFVDAHAHLAQTGFALSSVDLSACASLNAALDAVREVAGAHDGSLLQGFGWDETRWPEGRPFTGAEVDRAVGDRPVYLGRVDGHSAVVSSALLARIPHVRQVDGFTDDGRVERDAHHVVRGTVQALLTAPERRTAIERALTLAASRGIAAVHELGAPHLSVTDDFATIRSLRGGPEVYGYWGELHEAALARDLGCLGAAGDLNADGAIGSRTAAMTAPYADADSSGHRYLDVEDVRDHVVACTRADLQAGFHCIGDDAVATVIEGFRAAERVVGRDALVWARHRLEHVEMIDAGGIATMADLGIVASVQPVFDAWWGGNAGLYALRLGERQRAMNPFGSLARAGVVLAFGSDTPITPFDPWAAVRAAAFHHTPEERMTVRAAFGAHTRGGWRAVRRDDAGVLAPGSDATLAVWAVPGGLTVQTPDARVASWSTDPRAGVPVLPTLEPGEDLPTCHRTYLAGDLIHDHEVPTR